MITEKLSEWMQKLSEKKIKLLSELEITSDEMEELKTYFINRVIKSGYLAASPDLKIAIFMVNTAIEKYADGKYWDLLKEYIGVDIPQTRLNSVRDIFYKTLTYFDLLRLPTGKNVQYTEMIKAHAFVTNNYMDGFFDFTEAYYREVLFCQLNRSELPFDIAALSDFMKDSLTGDDTVAIEEHNGKAPRSYRLLKSTRSVFAYLDTDSTTDLFYPILSMFDRYHRFMELPEPDNRFAVYFRKWLEKREEDDSEHQRRSFVVTGRKPYITFNDSEFFVLNIPRQRFYANECSGDAYAVIELGYADDGYEPIKRDLDPFKKCGIYVTDELMIAVPSPFIRISIKIFGSSENEPIREFIVEESSYRILDAKYKSIPRLKSGVNMIAAAHGCVFSFNDKVKETDRYMSRQFDLHTVECMDDAAIFVGNRVLRFTTADYADLEFESGDDPYACAFTALTPDGEELRCTTTHPTIRISVQKQFKNGISVRINDKRWTVSDLERDYSYAVVEEYDSDFSGKVHLLISLEELCDKSQCGICDVDVYTPAKVGKFRSWRYIHFLEKFLLIRSRKYCYYGEDMQIIITQGYEEFLWISSLTATDDVTETENYTSITTRYYYTCDDKIGDNVELAAKIDGNKFTLRIPVPKFRIGASPETLEFRPTIFWYKELPANLFIAAPGASGAELYAKINDTTYRSPASLLGDVFSLELSEIKSEIIKCTNHSNIYLDLDFYGTNRKHSYITVGRKLYVNNLYNDNAVVFDNNEKCLRINIHPLKFADKAQLGGEITDLTSGLTVYDGRLYEGENIISDVDTTHDFLITTYMIEKQLFSSKKTEIGSYNFKSPYKVFNFENCFVRIAKIFSEDGEYKTPERVYGFDYITKTDENIYRCRMYRAPVVDGSPVFKDRQPFAQIILKVTGSGKKNYQRTAEIMVVKQDGSEEELYYDTQKLLLVNPDNPKMKTAKNRYTRFIPLYNDETVFLLNLKNRKENKNDI